VWCGVVPIMGIFPCLFSFLMNGANWMHGEGGENGEDRDGKFGWQRVGEAGSVCLSCGFSLLRDSTCLRETSVGGCNASGYVPA